MAKLYTIEVTKESRALVQIEAETISEAQEKIRAMVAEGTIDWKLQDHLLMDVVNSRELKK